MRTAPKLLLLALALLPGCSRFASNFTGRQDIRPKGVDLYVAGVQAYKAGDSKLAQVRFEQAINVNPNLRMARSTLGDIYRSQGDYQRAREQYEILTRLDPYGAENYYRLGITYQFLQMIQDAVGSYLRALDIQPRDMRSSMNLGLAFLTLNQRDDAVKYLRRATELSPTWADAWTNLGAGLDAQNDLPGAERAYKKALELDKKQNAALLNLATNLIRQNRGAEAVSVMEEAVKRADNAPTRTRYGRALTLAKRLDDALTQYQLALKFDPRYYTALNERGTTLIAMYEKGLELDDRLRMQAIAAWRESLKIYPDQPQIRRAIQQWSSDRPLGPRAGI